MTSDYMMLFLDIFIGAITFLIIMSFIMSLNAAIEVENLNCTACGKDTVHKIIRSSDTVVCYSCGQTSNIEQALKKQLKLN